jgi:hypothetical protein
VEPLENLVVGVDCFAGHKVDKSGVNIQHHGLELYVGVQVIKDAIETLYLLGVISKDEILDALVRILIEVANDKVEVLIEAGLWLGIAVNGD